MALRELALRRTADRVEDDVQAYRSRPLDRARLEDRGGAPVLHRPERRRRARRARARRCSPQQLGGLVARGLRRDAGAAAAAEGAARAHPARAQARRGARRDDGDAAGRRAWRGAVVDYAREHNLSKIVHGRTTGRASGGRRARWRSSSASCARRRPDRDRRAAGRGARAGARPTRDDAGRRGACRAGRATLVAAARLRLLTTAATSPLAARARPAPTSSCCSCSPCVGVALRLRARPGGARGVRQRRWPSTSSSCRRTLSFAVTDVQYLLTFARDARGRRWSSGS